MAEIIIDQALAAEAAKLQVFGKPDKHKFVLAMANLLDVDAQRYGRAGVGDLFNPFGEKDFFRVKTNDAYDVLATVYDLLPEEFKFAEVVDISDNNNGYAAYRFDGSIIPKLDLRPYILKASQENNFSGDKKEIADKTVATINAVNDAKIAEVYFSMGIPPNDNRVVQAQTARRNDTTSAAAVDFTGYTARPAAEAPSLETGEEAAGPPEQPAAPGTAEEFIQTSQSLLNMPGGQGVIGSTPEEFLQAMPDAGVADLAAYFGDYTFDLTGMVFTGGVYSNESGEKLSSAQALAYPYSLKTKGQKIALQETLRKSGYFDLVGQQPSAGYIDSVTKVAWDLALADSVRNGLTINQHLQERVKNYPRELVASQGVVYADPDALKLSARKFGVELMGRGLTETELESFISYIRRWEDEAALNKSFVKDNYEVELAAKAQSYFENRYTNEVMKYSFEDFWKSATKQKA